MLEFLVLLIGRSLAEIIAAKGTTVLGGVYIPAAFLFLQFLIKTIRRREVEFNKEDFIAGGLAAGIILVLLFGYFIVWRVPREIRAEARGQITSVSIKHIRVPANWKDEYLARKNHDNHEQIAAASGWITKERQDRIENILTANYDHRCALNYGTIGNIDPRQLEPIKQALHLSRWPDMQQVFQTGTLSITVAGNPYASKTNHEKLSVFVPNGGQSRTCGEAVCKALGIRCRNPNDAVGVLPASMLRQGADNVLLIVKEHP